MSHDTETDTLLEYQRNVLKVQQQVKKLVEHQIDLMKSLHLISERCREIKNGHYQSRQRMREYA